ncbi:glycosyltransferase [Marinobacter sp.]|uniref:glycosyltransferase n=2 Tax=Marinobacter TaxID=2742 RepID=UPI0023536A55
MKKSVWITWDNHRRSSELASCWDMEYKVFEYPGWKLARYFILSFKTLWYLYRERPVVVVCQNPSIVLAALLATTSRIQGFFLMVDRHSNFKIRFRGSSKLKWKVFHFISDYSIRLADLTIVTNSEARNYVESLGGKCVVLPDKMPSDLSADAIDLKGDVNFLFICSFDGDEPVDAVLNAFKRLTDKYCIYITGNYKKYDNWKKYVHAGNIRFLGFVGEEDYLRYLNSVDATIVLTNMPMTLNCGSYESVKACKPQIVADSTVIKEWFRSGAVYVDPNDETSIYNGIIEIIERLDELKNEQEEFCRTVESDWLVLDERVRQMVYELSGHQL